MAKRSRGFGSSRRDSPFNKNMTATKRSRIEEMRKWQTAAVVSFIPADVDKAMRAFGTNLVLAGGFVRDVLADERPQDIDLFASSLTFARQARDLIGGKWFEVGARCDERGGFGKLKVQVISTRVGQAVEELIDGFDFVCCQGAVYFNTAEQRYEGMMHEDMIDDAKRKKLELTENPKTSPPEHSLRRAFDFARRGYTIEPYHLAKLVQRVARVSDKRWEKIHDRLQKSEKRAGASHQPDLDEDLDE